MTSCCNRFFKIILRKNLEHGNLDFYCEGENAVTASLDTIEPCRCMKIPKNFTRKYGGGLSNPMFLKPPDGTEWKVYWTKNDGEIWFQKGWKEFATYYSLDHGHLVVFEYEGTSHFEVHIFDMSALEIEYPFHDQISDDSVEILSELSPCQKKRLKSPMSSPQPHKKLRTGTTRDVESSPNPLNLLQHVQTKGSQSEGTNFEMPIIASIKQELDDGKSTQRTSLLISPRPGTTGNMKEAKKFTSENPFFIISIRQSYLKKIKPSISTVFVRKYFQKKKKNVMIQFGKKLWPGKVLYYPSRYHASFSAGWSLFAEESKLQAGDVCIFELINREDAVLDVHIFRGYS